MSKDTAPDEVVYRVTRGTVGPQGLELGDTFLGSHYPDMRVESLIAKGIIEVVERPTDEELNAPKSPFRVANLGLPLPGEFVPDDGKEMPVVEVAPQGFPPDSKVKA